MLTRRVDRGALRVSWVALAAVWVLALLCGSLLQEPPTAYLHGYVVRVGHGPASGVTILCRGMSGPNQGKVLFGETDLHGGFDLPVPPGTYEVEASAEQGPSTAPQEVVLRDGQTSALAFRLPAVSRTWVDIFAPQRVFLTSETAQIGVRGESREGVARVVIERVDLLGMVASVGAGAWLDVWGGEIGGGDLKRLSPYLERLADQPMPLTRRGDADFINYLDLPTRQPGAYLITVAVDGLSARTSLMITDLGLVAKTDRRQTIVYACDLASGAPKPGVELRVHRQQTMETPQTIRTDAKGLATLPEVEEPTGSATVLGLLGDDVAVVRTQHWFGQGTERQVAVTTDRPIYRPGQRVYLKGIVRDRDGDDWTVPAPLPVKLRVSDGRGDEIAALSATTNDLGSFNAELDIPEESFVGEFYVEGTAGEERFSGSFTVKAYVKPEYQVTAAGPEAPVLPEQMVHVALQATYFFDAPVAGGTVKYRVQRHRSWWEPPRRPTGDETEDWDLALPEWEEELYRGTEGDSSYGEQIAEGQATLDDAGRLRLSLPARALLPPPARAGGRGPDGNPVLPEETGAYGIDIECLVSDGSGRQERAVAQATLLPTDYLLRTVGRDDWTEQRHTTVAVEAITTTGAPVPNQRLTVQPYRLRWVRDCQTARGEWVTPVIPNGFYLGCTHGNDHLGPHGYREVILPLPPQTTVTGADGRAKVPLDLPYLGSWRVIVTGDDGGGRPVVTSQWIYVTDETGALPDWNHSADLELTLERDHWFVGQRPRLRVSAETEQGWVLLTHEGRTLGEPQLLPLANHFAIGEVTASAGDIPNGWVGAAMVRDKELHQAEQSFQTDLKARLLEVEVTASRTEAQPGDAVTFTVRTSRGGQPVDAEVSLAVVDEAIYAMKRDHPERVITAFYGRQWNEVGTFFSAEPYYYTAGKEEAGPVRRQFPDTALWQPNLRTGPSGEVAVSLTLPDNLSTWRATAIAHSAATEIGFGTANVLVKKPLMVRLTTPRFLTSGDRVELNAMIHNESGREQAVEVTLDTAHLEVDGRPTRRLTIAAGERGAVTWRAVCGREREVRLRVTARGGGLQDAVEKTLPIVPFARRTTAVERGKLTPSGTTAFDLPIGPGGIPDLANLAVRVAPTVGGEIAAAAEDLIGYPYGCVEQTTSRFVGCLAAQQAFETLGWRQAPPFDRETVAGHVRSGILRLRRMQNWGGGWGWWEGGTFNEAMTAYAVRGLHLARQAGHLVDTEMLESGLDALRKEVKAGPAWHDWRDEQGDHHVDSGGRLTRARSLEAMVQCGQTLPPGVLVEAFDHLSDGRAITAALLAIAAHGAGNRQREAEALGQLERLLKEEMADDDDRTADDVETLAWALEAELTCRGATPRAESLATSLRETFGGERWVGTRDSATAIRALCDWLVATGEPPMRGELAVTVNGQPLAPFTFDDATAQGRGAVYRVEPALLREGDNRIELSLSGQGTPRYVARLTAPAEVDGMEPIASADGTRITRRYRRLERTRDHQLVARNIVGGRVAVDDVVQVELQVEPGAEARYVMIEDPLPAGCEVLDRGETVNDSKQESWDNWSVWCAARDTKDDHVAYFLDTIRPDHPFTLRYLVRAAVPGRYRVLPTTLAPMYQPEIVASGDDDVLTVR